MNKLVFNKEKQIITTMRTKTFRTLFTSVKKYCTIPEVETNQKNLVTNLKPGSRVSILRMITKEDVLAFAQLTNDYNPIHVNSEKNIAHGAFLNGLLSGILGTKLPGPGTLVVEQILRFPKPCFVGDTVELSVEIVSVRKIIKCKYKCIANTNRVVLEGEAKLIKNDDVTQKIQSSN